MSEFDADYRVTFPTLGDLVDAWIEQHCRVPDKFHRGEPFRESDWQFWVTANHYRIREGVEYEPGILNRAFHYRRSQIVGPQKLGKGPWSASVVANEAVGPSLLGGFAGKDDGYSCADDGGCGCGWEYPYEPGEPMGIRHPSPLIQLTAISEDQVDNVWRPLTAMIRLGPLSDLLGVRDNWLKIAGANDDPELDRVDKVTASANSRVGNPITFALQDESGLATDTNKMRKVYEAQRRNAAGIGGRTMETTNAWDPAERSVAQTTAESNAPDVFRYHRQAPKHWSFRNKEERGKILRYVYFGSPWVPLDSVEGEAVELMEKDPAQAERFFGNRIIPGGGSWLSQSAMARWEQRLVPGRLEIRDRPKSEPICLGFDGSDVDDWTALRAETLDGVQFTPTNAVGIPTVWDPATSEGRIPRADVFAAIVHVYSTHDVVRGYFDPPGYETMISDLQGKFGDKRVTEWFTQRVQPMWAALERFRNDVVSDVAEAIRHDADETADVQLRNAIMRGRTGKSYILGKPTQHQKIDVTMASVLAHEAVADAVAGGDLAKRTSNISTTYFAF